MKAENSFAMYRRTSRWPITLAPAQMLYATAARGFKAGGFNAASPTGSEAYGEEHSWNYEGGVKTLWFADRLSVNGALFYLTWDDLQVNLPNNRPCPANSSSRTPRARRARAPTSSSTCG